MSDLTIAPYFPFRRIKILSQSVEPNASCASIEIEPRRRLRPVCHQCGQKVDTAHSWAQRRVRDLNLASTEVWLDCRYRKVFCPCCQRISVEDLELFDPYIRVTRRLAYYVYQLCQVMTVTEVAKHLHLDWKTVKTIDKQFLERGFGQPDLNDLQILAVDEIAVRRGHRYLTVVLDYLSGRIVFVGKDRKADTLMGFFNQMTPEQRKSIKAVAMDMWDPFIKAVKKNSRGPKSYSICSMLLPLSAGSSIKSATASTEKPQKTIKPFLKGRVICF
jgi:transposase